MTDKQLQQYVKDALDWAPNIDAADIGVTVDDQVVTLRGDVKTYSEKVQAERVAVGVYGVKAIANDIKVHPSNGFSRTDSDIAKAVMLALEWNTQVPHDKLSVSVSGGWVTLTGKVDWDTNDRRRPGLSAISLGLWASPMPLTSHRTLVRPT